MPRLSTLPISLLFVLALSGCASSIPLPPPPCTPVTVPPAQLPPPPADVMVPRDPTFRDRLLSIFSPSPTTPTTSPASSPPARP